MEISRHHYDNIIEEYSGVNDKFEIEARALVRYTKLRSISDHMGKPAYPGLENDIAFQRMIKAEVELVKSVLFGGKFKITDDFDNKGNLRPDRICEACPNLIVGFLRRRCRLYDIESRKPPMGF